MWWVTATHVLSRPSVAALKWPENGNSTCNTPHQVQTFNLRRSNVSYSPTMTLGPHQIYTVSTSSPRLKNYIS